VVETARMVILTDGKTYRISMDSAGSGGLRKDAYDLKADYGSDGQDTFVVSDQVSLYNRNHDGWSGFASAGRVPNGQRFVPPAVQAAWLAYCAGDYFNQTNHQTGLDMGLQSSMIWPGYITGRPGRKASPAGAATRSWSPEPTHNNPGWQSHWTNIRKGSKPGHSPRAIQ